MKEVEITEENYKGYVELYKYKNNPYDDRFLINLIIDGLKIGGLVFLTALLGAEAGLLNDTMTVLFMISAVGGSLGYYNKKIKTYEEINTKNILNEYPNIENVDLYNLSKALKKVGLIKYNELDVNGYETKIKGNKLKEETLNEQKYEYRDLLADYIAPEHEIEKVKQKIRKMYK